MTHHHHAPAAGPSPNPAGPAIAGLALLALAAAGLVFAGAVLPTPPRDPAGWAPWYAHHGPATTVAALARVVALLGVGYLTTLGLLGLVLRLDPRGRRLADRIPAWVGRPVLERAFGVGMVTGLGVTLSPVVAAAEPTTTTVVDEAEPTTSDTVLMVPIGDATVETSPPTTVGSPSAAGRGGGDDATPSRHEPAAGESGEVVATMVAVDSGTEEPPASTPSTTTPSPDPRAPVVPAGDDDPPPHSHGDRSDVDVVASPGGVSPSPAAASWRVELGDHLWAIAAETVGEAGLPADDEHVLAYWVRLLEANRERLVDPQNPDLLYPGQVLDLPAVSVGSG